VLASTAAGVAFCDTLSTSPWYISPAGLPLKMQPVEQQQQQRSRRPTQDSAATHTMQQLPQRGAAAPEPAPQQQRSLDDECVWRLLLEELWQPLEQEVVCKLLCCSSTMAQLVHSTCAGVCVAVSLQMHTFFASTFAACHAHALRRQQQQASERLRLRTHQATLTHSSHSSCSIPDTHIVLRCSFTTA
jgi:hypothetical protein